MSVHMMDGQPIKQFAVRSETVCTTLPSPSHRPTPPSSPFEELSTTMDQTKEPVQEATHASRIGAATQLSIRTQQDAPSTSALVSEQDTVMLRLVELLATVVKKSTAAESEPNTPTASEKSTTKEDQPQTERASIPDYKRVDEV
jgi:hypothetical protein